MDANESTPPSWRGYGGTDDVAATVAKISAAGGKVYTPTKTMENVGTFAVTADPERGPLRVLVGSATGVDRRAPAGAVARPPT